MFNVKPKKGFVLRAVSNKKVQKALDSGWKKATEKDLVGKPEIPDDLVLMIKKEK